jgi:hypothetical protein
MHYLMLLVRNFVVITIEIRVEMILIEMFAKLLEQSSMYEMGCN